MTVENLPEYVSTGQIEVITGYSRQALARLFDEGIIEKKGHGKWPLAETIKALLDNSNDDLKEQLLKERVGKIKDERQKLQIQIGKEMGELVDRAAVREDALMLAQIVKIGLRRFRSSLPPAVVGLDVAAVEKVVEAKTDELERDFSDQSSELYRAMPAAVKELPAAKKTARKRAAKKAAKKK